MYEAGLCSCGCGFPARLAHDPNFDGYPEVAETVCYARQALDLYRDEHEKDKRQPGVLIGLKDMRPPEHQERGTIPR